MGDQNDGWTTVGHTSVSLSFGRAWEDEQESKEREAIDAWDNDDHWPGIDKPLFSGPDAKRFDARLVKLDDLGYGAFGRVEKIVYDSVTLARKRIPRRRGFTIDDLRQEGLTMRKLNHRHIVRLVATYAPRCHELCLLIWPAAVCNLGVLLDDIECLRLGEGDREDILERLGALDLTELSAIESAPATEQLQPVIKCPLHFLRGVIGCVARAMAHCHSNNVRHLDIKPSNVLLKAGRVYLADFGVSRDVSGEDHTTIDGLPGTEKWRAPELYDSHGSSMQLSDIYSLGLVYMNIATVMYNARLADFDKAMSYPPRQSREEQLRTREEQLTKHLGVLTSHSLVTAPFMFTYEGQETMRPRPILSLVSRMVAACPKNRLSADKMDEKLSVLGGIHQIYHAECCKRPVSWVEGRWDRKFAGLANLRKENERQRRRIEELEGKDKTYELRLENARRTHEQDVARLQTLLKEAEEKCQQLKQKPANTRKGYVRESPRPNAAGQSPARRCSGGSRFSFPGNGPNVSRSTTRVTEAGPLTPSPTQPTRDLSSQNTGPAWSATRDTRNAQPRLATQGKTGSPGRYSPNSTNLAGYALRSRDSASKLPLPVTPRRTWTPTLDRDQSLTDSSMASSIFSRGSLETVPTPAQNSPALDRNSLNLDESQVPQWGRLAKQPMTSDRQHPRSHRSCTPTLIAPGDPTNARPASVDKFACTVEPNLASQTSTADPKKHKQVPSLQPTKSWAEIAMPERGRLKPRG